MRECSCHKRCHRIDSEKVIPGYPVVIAVATMLLLLACDEDQQQSSN